MYCKYSGGGTQVIQQLIEDVTEMKFSDVAREVLFDPLNMKYSGYEADYPNRISLDVAAGHDSNGIQVVGGWYVYPQAAAAGLWTTSLDLARFLMEIINAYHGENPKVLSQEMVKEMLTPQKNSFHGLGPILNENSQEIECFHSGANLGYRTYFVCFPESKKAVAITTNNDNGDELIREIIRSLAQKPMDGHQLIITTIK